MGSKASKSKKKESSTTTAGNTFDNLRKMGYSIENSVDAINKCGNDLKECISFLACTEKETVQKKSIKQQWIEAPVSSQPIPPEASTRTPIHKPTYETAEAYAYEPTKNTSLKPNTDAQTDPTLEYNIKEILVTGYIRHVIFVLLGNDDDETDESIMNIIPLDVIKLCEQYYEANMIMFLIQSCFNQSLLNGIECINLNCKKIIKFRTVSMENTDNVVTMDQHWFDKTVYTYYLANITIPQQAYKKYPDILSPIKQPSIILKAKLNSWRNEHESSMIIFDNRLLHNWNFTQENSDKNGNHFKLLTDLDANTKQIDTFEMKLPTISYTHGQSQLKMFMYSKDYGLLAMDNHNTFTIYRLKFSEQDDDEKTDGWKWVKLKTNLAGCTPMRSIQNVHGMCVIDSPSLQYGENEKLFMLSKINETNYRAKNTVPIPTWGNGNYAIKHMEMEVGYFDIAMNEQSKQNNSYRKLCRFNINSKPIKTNYYSTYAHQSAPETLHKGHLWIQPSLHYNKIHKKVFIAGDDTSCVEGYDIIKNKWLFLPQTQYIHSKGCTIWSLDDQSNDILYIDKGYQTRKTDNFTELFDLRSNQQRWIISQHYMQWIDIVSNEKGNTFSKYDYHVYQRTFI